MIAVRRRSSYALFDRLLVAHADRVEQMWGSLPGAEVPRTYPLLVPPGTSNDLYHVSNWLGFGVVSLYYTLIEQVYPERFSAPARLSRGILNSPVHQDVDPAKFELMTEALAGRIARHDTR